MRKMRLVFILMIAVLTIAACKKEQTTEPVEEPVVHVPDFQFTGDMYVHRPITFRSNYKDSTHLTWYFGNFAEMTIFGKQTKYTFEEPGTYKVTMAVLDSSGGTATKDVTITYGTDRLDGEQEWNFILKKEKNGAAPNLIPATNFTKKFAVNIIDDATIQIPDIPQMRFRGPYTVKRVNVDANEMVYRSDDKQAEISLIFETATGGINLIQASKDTTFRLYGFATIK